MTTAPRTRWTAAVETREGRVVSFVVYAAGRVRAGQLATWAADRKFGGYAHGVSLTEDGAPSPRPARYIAQAEAQSALAFARRHDWGENAYLEGAPFYRVAGLIDAWTQRQDDGSVTYHEEIASRPALVSELREFGNY